jgi:HSP20 family protein
MERGSIFMFGLVPFGSRKDLATGGDAFDRLFDAFKEPFFQNAMAPSADWGGQVFKVDVKDNGDSYELTADLPGLKKEDIALHYENSYLTIAAQQEESKDEKDDKGNYIRRERSSGSMSRSFYIDNIDEDRVDAAFENGVLKIHMPKLAETAKPKQIEIR